MYKFVKLDGSNQINTASIKFIINAKVGVIFVTTKEIITTKLDFNSLASKLRNDGFGKSEFVPRSLKVNLLTDEEMELPIVCLLNLNLVYRFSEEWEGQIEFIDGTHIESSFSYFGMRQSLGLNKWEGDKIIEDEI